MDIGKVLRVLDKIAPLKLAAKWDNVGLLVEPSAPHIVNKILLTNDLTSKVMQEAIEWNSDMIISYHPPIFQPIKKITTNDWKQQLVIKALENRIAIYSPHTACDAVCNGVNDWLAKGLGQLDKSESIEKESKHFLKKLVKLLLPCKNGNVSKCLKQLVEEFSNVIVKPFTESFEVEIVCEDGDLEKVFEISSHILDCDIKVIDTCVPSTAGPGMGRICHLKTPKKLIDLVKDVKQHLSLDKVRLATAVNSDENSEVSSVALCAGAGASVLHGVAADVYLTGEMSHHQVLDAVCKDISVILCEHSNTERGFLYEYKKFLSVAVEDKLEVKVSKVDCDPLIIC